MTAPVRTLRHALILLALLWAGAANALLMMSEAKEQEIGKTLYDQITAEMPIYPDQKVTDYVNTLGQKLVAHSDKPEGKFTFTVIDNGDINAFATPGGYIYIHRGLLAYLRSEAQLAAVLAHEIAHVTARHSARQQRAQTGSNVAAGLLAILSRSGEVGEATALWGAATVRGYGREMELEADGLGAQTMARAGYDRNAIIEVLGMLKDHERFEKQRAREAGREPQTYHGLFATHPRNDRRLAEIVASGATQSGGERGEIPFRIATDGLVWGRNTQSTPERENRYIDRDRAFRIDHPPGWTLSRTASGLTATAHGSGDGFTLEILPRTVKPPEHYIKNNLGIGFIKKSQAFVQAGLPAHTGMVAGNGGPDQRIAVIYYGRAAFVFRGNIAAGGDNASRNDELFAIIRSFAPLPEARFAGMEPQRIKYVKAANNATFAQLAAYLKLGPHGEQELRLINGYYPRGEPQNGEWIKIIR